MTTNQIQTWYKEWCKKTHRSGGILVGSSIKELLNDFAEQREDEDTWKEVQRIINQTRYKAMLSPGDLSIMVTDLPSAMQELKSKFQITTKI